MRPMTTLKLAAGLAVAAGALNQGATASAQDGPFGGAPTGVPMPSPGDIAMGPTRKAQRDPDRCNAFISSKLEGEIVTLHHVAGHCASYSRAKYDQYTDSPVYDSLSVEQSNDPLNYFRFYGMSTAPYEAAAVQLGFVEGVTTAPRVSDNAASKVPMAGGSVVGDETVAPGQVGACGVPLSTGLTAEAQTEADRIGTCEQIKQFFGG